MGSSSPNRDEHKQYLKLNHLFLGCLFVSVEIVQTIFWNKFQMIQVRVNRHRLPDYKGFAVGPSKPPWNLGPRFVLNLDAQKKLRSYGFPPKGTLDSPRIFSEI